MDFRGTYRRLSFNNLLDSRSFSLETDLNFRNIKLIAGYSSISFHREMDTQTSLHGISIGVGTHFNMLFYPVFIGKAQIYNGAVEYQANLQGSITRRVLCFIKFYKFKTFDELSLGIGVRVGYRFANRGKSMLRSPRPIPDG